MICREGEKVMGEKLARLALVPALLLVMANCTADLDDESAAESHASQSAIVGGDVRLPATSGENATILYNRFTQRLVAYDTSENEIQQESDEANYFQYEFPTPSEYFTAGSSVSNGFSIIRVHGSSIDEILRVRSDEGVFPLATDGSRLFFTLSHYDDNGLETSRALVKLDEGKLVPHAAINGLIDGGAILGKELFFTMLDEESNTYRLFKVPVESASTPTLVREGLASGRLYAHAGEIYTADRTSIFNGEDRFECADLCYFYDREGLLLRLHVNDVGDISLDVVDAKTKRVVKSVSGVIDFRVASDYVTVYRIGAVDRVQIANA